MKLLRSRTAELSVPVISGEIAVGNLRLVSDTSDLAPRLRAALATTFYGALLALAIALAIVLRLQRGITRPLSELTQTMARVGKQHDYYSVELQSRTMRVRHSRRGFNPCWAISANGTASSRGIVNSLKAKLPSARRTTGRRAMRPRPPTARSPISSRRWIRRIRTPMNGILVMADLLAAGDLPPSALAAMRR